MNKVKRIKRYNKKYYHELINAINEIWPFLIQAFINVYGEKHRDYITHIMNELKFVYFVPEDYVNILLNNPGGISKRDVYILNKYREYLKHLDEVYLKYSDEEACKQIIRDFVVASDIDVQELEGFIEIDLAEDSALYTTMLSGMEAQKIILLPIFVTSLRMLIHEINHALSIDGCLIHDDELLMLSLFLNEECEEAVSDFIALIVFQEFIRIFGYVPKPLDKFNYVFLQEEKSYLIEEFYYAFEPVILEALITKNYNLLRVSVGEDNFRLFCDLVKDGYNTPDELVNMDLIYHCLSKMIKRFEENFNNDKFLRDKFGARR